MIRDHAQHPLQHRAERDESFGIFFIMVLTSIVDVSANDLNNTAFAAATWSTAFTPTLKFGNLV